MSTKFYKGQSTPVAKVMIVTPAVVEIGDVFSILIDGEVVATFTALAATVASVATGLAAAWNASSDVRAATCTATVVSSTVVLTADTLGMPFVITCSTVDGGGNDTQTLVPTTSIANVSANDAGNLNNWSDGVVLTTSDVVVLENSASHILHTLDQSAVTLASLTIKPTYTGRIGLYKNKFATTATTHSATKSEYRDEYLKIGVTNFSMPLHVGAGSPSSSSRVNVNFGTVQTTVLINGTSQSSADDQLPPVRLLGTHAANKLTMTDGVVGSCLVAGELSTWTEVNVSDGILNLGVGATLTTLNVEGGDVQIASAVTTINQDGGKITVNGSGGITTINCNGGEINYNGSGTITNLNVRGKCVLSSGTARTITNCNLFAGANLMSDESTTFTNGIDLKSCGIEDVTLQMGKNINIS